MSSIIIQSHLIDTAAMGKKEKGEALTTGGEKSLQILAGIGIQWLPVGRMIAEYCYL